MEATTCRLGSSIIGKWYQHVALNCQQLCMLSLYIEKSKNRNFVYIKRYTVFQRLIVREYSHKHVLLPICSF